jgi:hypothetical protein
MLERLSKGFTTTYDIEFYLHELKESSRFIKFGDILDAHHESLNWRRVSEFELFHPDVVQKHRSYFNMNWR